MVWERPLTDEEIELLRRSKMLVLTRKPGEGIIVEYATNLATGEPLTLKIVTLKINGGQVSIGIDAPKEVKIVREELLTRDKQKGKKNEST